MWMIEMKVEREAGGWRDGRRVGWRSGIERDGGKS